MVLQIMIQRHSDFCRIVLVEQNLNHLVYYVTVSETVENAECNLIFLNYVILPSNIHSLEQKVLRKI